MSVRARFDNKIQRNSNHEMKTKNVKQDSIAQGNSNVRIISLFFFFLDSTKTTNTKIVGGGVQSLLTNLKKRYLFSLSLSLFWQRQQSPIP